MVHQQPSMFYVQVQVNFFSVIDELGVYGVNTPSDSQAVMFKKTLYDKYLKILTDHITYHFPDRDLLEAFSLFDPSTIPGVRVLAKANYKCSLFTIVLTT